MREAAAEGVEPLVSFGIGFDVCPPDRMLRRHQENEDRLVQPDRLLIFELDEREAAGVADEPFGDLAVAVPDDQQDDIGPAYRREARLDHIGTEGLLVE